MDASLTLSSYINGFNREVIRWRTGAATAWSLIFVLPLTFIFFIVSAISVFCPTSSLTDCLFNVATLELWLVVGLLMLTVFVSARLNAYYYRVSTFVPYSRFEKLYNCIRPRRILFIIGHVITTGAATWCATRLVGSRFKVLSYPCPHDLEKQCLNEFHLFIVLYGCINGAIMAITFFTTGKYVMRFPPVTQRKLFEVKGQFNDLITNAASHAFKYLKYYCFAYYFLSGRIVKISVMKNFDLDFDRNSTSVDTVRGMMDLSLLFYAWLTVTFAIILVSLPHLLHCAYNLQPYCFPIEPPFDSVRDLCLHYAIVCEGSPLLQYLACHDLARLSKHSVARRQQLFSLTALSSQPVNWNNLNSACLAELNKFTQSLATYCGVASANGIVHSYVVKPTLSVTSQQIASSATTTSDPGQSKVPSFTKRSNKLLNELRDSICRRPLIAYFISDTPVMVSRRLFADAQKYIFIVDGLSRIVCASFVEDTYGVVQPSLSSVVSTLLDMLDAVDRHLKMCPVVLRRPRASGCGQATGNQIDVALRFALKTAIKCAIYRLVVTFQLHLNSIDLSPEHKKRLLMFEDFKE